jgi:hypothetical protein
MVLCNTYIHTYSLNFCDGNRNGSATIDTSKDNDPLMIPPIILILETHNKPTLTTYKIFNAPKKAGVGRSM